MLYLKKAFAVIFLSFFIFSCSKSEDSNNTTPDQKALDQADLVGIWTTEQVEIKYRCDNDALLDEGFDSDVVDNIGDFELNAEGTYHFLEDGEVTDFEDMNGQYEINEDMITLFFTVNGSPRTSVSRIIFNEQGDLELQDINYCETHSDLGIYYARRYNRVP